jgi:hypothetical protein
VAVVPYTEATMISAGQSSSTIVLNKVVQQVGMAGIAFHDSEESEGTMRACRNLFNFFIFLCRQMSKLHSKQISVRAVKPIQDVTMCWWSTCSMCNWLL